VADRVHAPVHAVQAARPGAPADGAVAEADLAELAARHDAVLAGRERRDRPIRRRRDDFCLHWWHFSSR
jgi:hypothetical protein